MTQATTALAFDFGLTRIGVAYGQRITGTATPVSTLTANQGVPDWSELDKLIQEWQPRALVVGRPVGNQNQATSIHGALGDFVLELKNRYALSVYEVDETLTSREAKDRLNQQRRSGQKSKRIKKGEIDSLSAQLILERWLAN